MYGGEGHRVFDFDAAWEEALEADLSESVWILDEVGLTWIQDQDQDHADEARVFESRGSISLGGD